MRKALNEECQRMSWGCHNASVLTVKGLLVSMSSQITIGPARDAGGFGWVDPSSGRIDDSIDEKCTPGLCKKEYISYHTAWMKSRTGLGILVESISRSRANMG